MVTREQELRKHKAIAKKLFDESDIYDNGYFDGMKDAKKEFYLNKQPKAVAKLMKIAKEEGYSKAKKEFIEFLKDIQSNHFNNEKLVLRLQNKIKELENGKD